MKIGVLGCGYNCHEGLEERLNPWFNFAKENNVVFSFVSAQFLEYSKLGYDTKNNAETKAKILELFLDGRIQHYYATETPQSEANARNEALRPLIEDCCDIIWLLDLSDEYYTESNIQKIYGHVFTAEDRIAWWSINFKNYIFDGKQWIDGFCPPRIFRNTIDYGDFRISSFYYDNDITYKYSRDSKIVIPYKYFPNEQIPKKLAHIKHMTWLHSNGKDKVKYQLAHFGHCSYKWNEEKNELEFDLDFYRKNDMKLPIINKDES